MFGLSGRARSVYKTCERQAARDTARGEANFPDSGANIEFHVGASTPFLSLSLSLFPLRALFPLLFFWGTSPCIVISWLYVGYEYSFVVCVYVCVCEWIYVTSKMGNVSRFLSSPSSLTDETLSNLESSTMSMPSFEYLLVRVFKL